MSIKIDSALILDSFSLLHNNVAAIIFIYLKFNTYLDEYGANIIDINIKNISKKTNIKNTIIKKALNILIKQKFIFNKENNIYYIFDEFDFFDKLRVLKREKFYTRGVVFNIKKSFFYKFLKNIKDNYLAFRLYYFLLIITQHDLWSSQLQVRSKTPMTEITKLARVWCMEDIFFKNITILINIGLIKIDQKHKVHTLTKFVV